MHTIVNTVIETNLRTTDKATKLESSGPLQVSPPVDATIDSSPEGPAAGSTGISSASSFDRDNALPKRAVDDTAGTDLEGSLPKKQKLDTVSSATCVTLGSAGSGHDAIDTVRPPKRAADVMEAPGGEPEAVMVNAVSRDDGAAQAVASPGKKKRV